MALKDVKKYAQNFVPVEVQTLWATLLPLYTKECVGSLTSQLTTRHVV